MHTGEDCIVTGVETVVLKIADALVLKAELVVITGVTLCVKVLSFGYLLLSSFLISFEVLVIEVVTGYVDLGVRAAVVVAMVSIAELFDVLNKSVVIPASGTGSAQTSNKALQPY